MNILIEDAELKIVDVSPDDSDSTISGFITRCEIRDQTYLPRGGWRVSFSGFNDDPRELIEIPEAREFARRLINLGFLTILQQPQPERSYIIQDHIPAIDALGVHAIAVGIGDVRKRGGKINIGMDVDISAYFTDLLTGLRKRNVPADIQAVVERIIARQKEFNPLAGSGSITANAIIDEELQRKSGL